MLETLRMESQRYWLERRDNEMRGLRGVHCARLFFDSATYNIAAPSYGESITIQDIDQGYVGYNPNPPPGWPATIAGSSFNAGPSSTYPYHTQPPTYPYGAPGTGPASTPYGFTSMPGPSSRVPAPASGMSPGNVPYDMPPRYFQNGPPVPFPGSSAAYGGNILSSDEPGYGYPGFPGGGSYDANTGRTRTDGNNPRSDSRNQNDPSRNPPSARR